MRSDHDTVDTYMVEETVNGRGSTYPLISAYAKVKEADGEILQRAPEFPNDDDRDPGRHNAAGVGRRSGLVEVDPSEMDDPEGAYATLFDAFGQARADRVRSQGAAQQADQAAAEGGVVRTEKELAERGGLLVEEAMKADEESQMLRDQANRLEQEREELPLLARGLIGPGEELFVAGILGFADVALFGSFLQERAGGSTRLAWATAIFVGLGVAAAGWGLGRGLLARTETHTERSRALLGLTVAFALAAAWFVIGMEITRTSGSGEGELATIAFGAPLCALAMIATAIVSFVAGAGALGRRLASTIAELRSRAAELDTRALESKQERHRLCTALAQAMGARTAAHSSMPLCAQATDHAAAAELHEGRARWGLARAFARMFAPARSGEAPDAAVLPPLESPTGRPALCLIAALAALGALVGALVSHLVGAPVEIIALGAAACAAMGTWLAFQTKRSAASPSVPAAAVTRASANGRLGGPQR